MSPRNPLLRALRRRRRKLFGLLRPPRAQLVYSPRYPLELPGSLNDPLRGERILSFLESTGLLSSRALHDAPIASFRHLRRVHTDEYLEALSGPDALTRIFGLQLSDEQSERVLEAQRAMVGGTLLATGLALDAKGVAVNLGGGLHHAFAGRGERFCAFNDVAVAVRELRARGFDERVLVVDLDLHDGDGTRSIFADDPTVHTFSIHNLWTPDERGRGAVAATDVELAGEVDDETYLRTLRERLPPVFAAFRPEMVFYLAGCDPAADDRIGDWKISPAGMLERDLFVMSCARGGVRKLPVVVVLAGGYGRNAWRYSARFFSALLHRGEAIEPPELEESTLLRYRRVAREIASHELTGEAPAGDWGLTADDIAPVLGGMRRPHRLLGFYSRQGLELAMERAGVLDRLRDRGFEPAVEMELGNPAGDTVRVYGDRSRRELLMEARLRVDRHEIPGAALLRIEWLLLQNPREPFTPARPSLPGQRHPGLGMLADIIALLVLACDRLQLDGLLFVPSHFHTAQGRNFRFVDPADTALYAALAEATRGLSLAEASRAVAEGKVIDERTGAPFAWKPMPMVLPVTDRLREKVAGEEYERRMTEAAAGYAFRVAPPPARR